MLMDDEKSQMTNTCEDKFQMKSTKFQANPKTQIRNSKPLFDIWIV